MVRLLLDTQAFLWSIAIPEKLSTQAREAIEESTNEVIVSAATAWEITIKHALGKLHFPVDPAIFVPARIAQMGYRALPIACEHAFAVAVLPDHHKDPFDRILVAQAQVENLTLVTSDRDIWKYPVHMLKT